MGNKKMNIVYYSGTGGTQRVAQQLESNLKQAGYDVKVQRLAADLQYEHDHKAQLLLLFAVHAFNAPEPVYHWIDNLEVVDQVPAAVISVSGGGEIMPNTASRVSTIKKLEKKGYKVTYETMLVMPSNWVVPTKPPLDKMLLDILPHKALKIVSDLDKGVVRRTKPLLIDRFVSRLGEIEKLGTKGFGKRIHCTRDCNGCGKCSQICPAGNITMVTGQPHFGNRCHMCLNCLYGCPKKALKPGMCRFVVLKEGYDLSDLEHLPTLEAEVDVEDIAKGYVWSGVKEYLLDRD